MTMISQCSPTDNVTLFSPRRPLVIDKIYPAFYTSWTICGIRLPSQTVSYRRKKSFYIGSMLKTRKTSNTVLIIFSVIEQAKLHFSSTIITDIDLFGYMLFTQQLVCTASSCKINNMER